MTQRSSLGVWAQAGGLACALLLAGCASAGSSPGGAGPAQAAAAPATGQAAVTRAQFEQDRKAILAMTGDYHVRFDFTETVAFAPGYELKPEQLSGGHEVVRVVEDRGDFISLQHILVVGGPDQKLPVKHWRQDWVYEPESVLVFIGGNAWETRAVPEAERKGRWSQVVYQVEDSPRYGAVGAWSHANGVSEWTGKAEWRPLPRRDATKRDDYDAIIAVNRHAITPDGWVHEQDNSKLSLQGAEPQVLARETGLNIYRKSADFPAAVATDYWDATKDFWADVRGMWSELEASAPAFGLTVQGEPEPLYIPFLRLAEDVQAGRTTREAAAREARDVIDQFTTTDIGTLETRIARAPESVQARVQTAAR